ncbi:MAG: MnhB domain-containing protein [Thermoplasmatota archaeon]
MNSIVVKTFGRALTPFILIYGIYVTILGPKSAGGGFQGGVILASGVILILVTHGREEVEKLAENISWFETFGAFVFLLVGIFGIILGGSFLTNLVPGDNYMFNLLEIIISLKVFAGLVALFIYFFGLGVRSSS